MAYSDQEWYKSETITEFDPIVTKTTLFSLKFGIIGLVEEQWVREFIDGDILYEDFVSVGKKLAKHLKTEVWYPFPHKIC